MGKATIPVSMHGLSVTMRPREIHLWQPPHIQKLKSGIQWLLEMVK